MLSYAPLDDDEIEEVLIKKPKPHPQDNRKECECTYLVMFFVFGAIILSMT
jgi:hypothetical protein